MFSWSAYLKKTQPVINNEVAVSAVHEEVERSSSVQIDALPEQRAESSFVFDHSGTKIFFDESTAAIEKIDFGQIPTRSFHFQRGLFLDIGTARFQRKAVDGHAVSFAYTDGQKEIIKKFSFYNFPYTIELEIIIRNLSSEDQSVSYPLFLGALDLSAAGFDARYQDIAIFAEGKIRHVPGKKTTELSTLDFIALRDRYYCAILQPHGTDNQGFIKSIDKKYGYCGVYLQNQSIPPGSQIGHLYSIYCGPQNTDLLASYQSNWRSLVNYGVFDPISQFLIRVLHWLYRLTHNWGVAVIFLSIAIYLLLFPMSIKQMRSMKSMQLLQPQIDMVRNTYKDNPQKMNKEIFALYKKHNINPLSGCLPILIQMPIFVALYPVLMRADELRGARFLWIRDLSAPDRIVLFPFSLPLLGNEINLLPILMAAGMFLQQKITSKTAASSQAAEQQKIMMFMLPVMFGAIFYRMPAGLVLYWLINSVIMLILQLKLNRSR